MNRRFLELIGWAGVVTILVAYACSTFGLLAAGDRLYGLLNLAGAAAIIASSWAKKDWQPVALNAVWAAVALLGLLS